MHTLNISIFNFINSGAGYYAPLDTLMLFVTTYLAYIIPAIIGLYVCVYLPARSTMPIARLVRMAQGGELVISVFLTWLSVQMIKVLVAYPRPFVTLAQTHLLVLHQSGYSFPSGHAGLTFAVATVVYMYHRKLGVLLYVFAGLVALSRVYVGVHYPVDVFVGALIGILLPLCIHKVFSQIGKYKVQ